MPMNALRSASVAEEAALASNSGKSRRSMSRAPISAFARVTHSLARGFVGSDMSLYFRRSYRHVDITSNQF